MQSCGPAVLQFPTHFVVGIWLRRAHRQPAVRFVVTLLNLRSKILIIKFLTLPYCLNNILNKEIKQKISIRRAAGGFRVELG